MRTFIKQNFVQLEWQKQEFIKKYWELQQETLDACKDCKINPYWAAKDLIYFWNNKVIEEIEEEINELISGNMYESSYMDTKNALYKIFENIKDFIKNDEIKMHMDECFSIEKYQTHVSAYIENILKNQ